ncbi:unnamed protein product [marine sediment metagenome]|uniref:Uncharacterized protein n=1 Tax=marine sediment metagenome TaxID=412755 RepID=X0WM54_9ZZZZ
MHWISSRHSVGHWVYVVATTGYGIGGATMMSTPGSDYEQFQRLSQAVKTQVRNAWLEGWSVGFVLGTGLAVAVGWWLG